MKSYLKPVILLILLATLLLSTRLTDATVQSPTNDTLVASQPTQTLDEAQVTTTLQRSSVMFIENVGQFDDDARFHLRGGDLNLWLAEDALWITLLEALAEDEQDKSFDSEAPFRESASDKPRKGVNLKLSFVDANPQPEIEPFNRLETKMNYFLGNDPDKWRSDVPVWGGVRYKNLYPGIDLELTSENGQTVQRLVAYPDADLSMVSLRVEGAESMELLPKRANGDVTGLRVSTAIGDVTLPLFGIKTPDGTPIDSTLSPTLNDSDIQAPFADSSQQPQGRVSALSLSGSELVYSTFIGDTSNDSYDNGYALALDSASNVLVTGVTGSSDFPTTQGSYDTTLQLH